MGTVKQEIARLGIIPLPEFWANTTRYHTPGPALLLHFLGSALFILAAPLHDANSFLVFSTIPNYARTVISVLLGIGLLFAPWIKGFKHKSEDPAAPVVRWAPRSSRLFKGFLVYPLTIFFVASNIFVLVLYWFPAQLKNQGQLKTPLVSNYVGPLIAMGIYAGAVAYWIWDRLILRALGYSMIVDDQDVTSGNDGLDVRITFTRIITNPAEHIANGLVRLGSWIRRMWTYDFGKRPTSPDRES